jgi:hypothetical protein
MSARNSGDTKLNILKSVNNTKLYRNPVTSIVAKESPFNLLSRLSNTTIVRFKKF